MNNNKKIPLANLYYMLSYIWNKSEVLEIEKLNSKYNHDVDNFLTSILIIELNKIIRSGLHQEYRSKNEEISTIKAKVDINSSISKNSFIMIKSTVTMMN